MTARVYRSQGFYRAVCTDEKCRAANRQRTYWRTPHTTEAGAKADAAIHNRQHHTNDRSTAA